MSRLVSWFSTPKGRRFTHFCVGAAAASAFCSHIAINGPLLDKVKDICQVYRFTEVRPLPPKINVLIEEVLKESTLKEKEKKKVKFFYVIGHDVFHAGGINSPWGAIIGIPFTFEDVQDINFGELKIYGKESIDWVIDGQDLIKSLSLSDSAKKFVLMRELYSCDFSHVIQNAVISAGCIVIPARFAKLSNQKLAAFEKWSVRKRSMLYVACYVFGFLLYRCLKDPLKHISDKDVDKVVAETGSDYLNGGIEYYKQTLLKQKALKELPGSIFKNTFDAQGNESYFLFAPKLPTSNRLQFLRDMRKEKMTKVDK